MLAGSLALLLRFGLAAPHPEAGAPGDAEVRQCREWIESHSPAPPAQTALTRVVSPRTICFDGQVYASTLKDAVAWADGAAKASRARPRLVVRSTGGDADVAMALAETLQRLGAEVTVVDYCMSSCANYFFAALPRRRVVPGALILFHGGFSTEKRSEFAEMLDKALRDPAMARGAPDPARWRADELKKFDEYVAREQALYRRIGVDPLVVTGISSVDETAIPASACGPRNGARRAFLFFDTKQLRRLGIRIEQGKPATDPAEVDRSLAHFGFRFAACAVPATYFNAKPGTGGRHR
jgi:hypothetical protein